MSGKLACVYFAGLDLAWGERSPTGVAVVDDTGRLRHVAAATDDADILTQLGPYTADACVVGIDAPLVVTNPTGTRPGETLLNRDFRRYDAGTYPANTGLAWFADGGRGARLCTALNLDLDPRSTSPRRALEVFPHSAAVVLFELDRTLKYKHKPGRDFAQLRGELRRLVSLIEDLCDAHPPLNVSANDDWQRITGAVRTATRKAQLRRAEDPIDAVLCAYVALFAHTRPEDVTIYGEPATGCIVTPTLKSTS